jgi:hypothetical protein
MTAVNFTLDHIKMLSADELKNVFRLHTDEEITKVILIAKILKEEGKLFENDNNVDEALYSYSKSIELLNLIPGNKFENEIREDIEFLKRKIN